MVFDRRILRAIRGRTPGRDQRKRNQRPMETDIKSGSLVSFNSTALGPTHDIVFSRRNPGLVLRSLPDRHYEILWSDGTKTMEHRSWLEKLS